MKKKFVYEFDDLSQKNTIRFEDNDSLEGWYEFETDDNNINLYANKKGYAYLAKIFIRLAEGNFSDGFHMHEPCDSEEIGEQPYKKGEITIFLNNKKG